MNDLKKEYCNIELVESEPIVTYKETVEAESKFDCMSKSPNKHNRITGKAMPLSMELQDAIEKGT